MIFYCCMAFSAPIEFWLDVDSSNNVNSALAIEKGIRLALDEVNYKVNGKEVRLLVKNHHGNVLRSLTTFKNFQRSKNALVMFGGVHSPPYIKNREFINNNKLLTMVIWAAGGPITRAKSEDNWIFRVSVDDNLAGSFLVEQALNKKHCKNVGLLLENTPWGNSNKINMLKQLVKHPNVKYAVQSFNWGVTKQAAISLLTNFHNQNVQCLITVGNGDDISTIVNATLLLPEEARMPIISHWGITTSNFHEKVPHSSRTQADISFLQTCFSFNNKLSKDSSALLERIKKLYPTIKSGKDIHSPVGVIHGYDATKIVIKAIEQMKWGDNILENRQRLKNALEHLTHQVNGLVKQYKRPFSVYHPRKNPRAHEALNQKDFCMAKYGKDNEIIIIK